MYGEDGYPRTFHHFFLRTPANCLFFYHLLLSLLLILPLPLPLPLPSPSPPPSPPPSLPNSTILNVSLQFNHSPAIHSPPTHSQVIDRSRRIHISPAVPFPSHSPFETLLLFFSTSSLTNKIIHIYCRFLPLFRLLISTAAFYSFPWGQRLLL